MTFELLLIILTLIATIVLAATGVIQAARSEMDFFGAFVLAMVTALGGGTIRDVLIDSPVFWINDLSYFIAIVPTCVLTIALISTIPKGKGIRFQILEYIDALGLALFTVIGIEKSLSLGINEVNAVIMGVITGVAGGMVRDILTNQVPTILKREVYGTAAIIGGLFYITMNDYLNNTQLVLSTMAIIFVIRVIAILFKLTTPAFKE